MTGLAERLRANVVVDLAGCWVWQGAKDVAGYGAIKINGVKRNAHRVAYETFVGPLPPRRMACHRCNHPPCINPEHLYAGDRAQNARDAIRAGKQFRPCLSSAQARTIRRSRMSPARLAKRFGVSAATVLKIRCGLTHRASIPVLRRARSVCKIARCKIPGCREPAARNEGRGLCYRYCVDHLPKRRPRVRS